METVKQASKRWGVSEASVKAWAKLGLIRAKKHGKSVWIITQMKAPVIKQGAQAHRSRLAKRRREQSSNG